MTQIRYFLALARTLNFTRAAEACNITQPALTKSIQRLEEEFGGRLLFRERSLTQLTELGRTMLPLLQQTWNAAEAARTQANSFRHRARAPMRVGLGPGIPASLFAPLMQELQRRFSGFELNLSRGTAGEINEGLLQAAIDVAVTTDSATLADRVNRWVLYSDRVAVMMPPGHPLAECDEVPAAALDAYPLISWTDDAGFPSRVLDRLRAELGLGLQVRHRGADEDGIQHLVLAGLGIALTTERQPRLASLSSRPLVDPDLAQEIVVAVVAGRPLAPAADALVRLCRARDWSQPPPP